MTQHGAKLNSAQITASDTFDPDSTPNNNVAGEDDQATANVTPQLADLSLSKTADITAPAVGQNVSFTISLRNGGPDMATGVQVRDVLPVGLTLVSATPSTGSYDPGNGIWTVGQVTSNTTANLEITATPTTLGTKTNTAEVIAVAQFDPDSTPNNNKTGEDDLVSLAMTPQSADLSLTKTVDKATPNVGQNVTFTVKVANAGPDAAAGVAVHDALPAGLTFVSTASLARLLQPGGRNLDGRFPVQGRGGFPANRGHGRRPGGA